MAYCKQCGAYIPDGQTKCLACGYDDTAEPTGANYAYQRTQTQDTRAEVEQRRAQRQEYNKTWAENEQRQRRMEEEFKRRQQEAEQRAESYVNRSGAQQGESTGSAPVSNPRGLAVLSYLGALFIIPMLVGQNDSFVKFHAKQGAKLFLCWGIGSALGAIFSLGWVVTILGIYLAYVGIRNALNGREEPLPIIGNWLWK